MSKSDLSPIEQSVAHFLKQFFPGKKNVSFVIGVSGGPDSMALLYILHKLDVELHTVHVNYQKRDEAADKDAALTEKVATDLGLNCEILAVDPSGAGTENFQQWARDVRYEAFELKAQQVAADGIATAHHRDDQIETVLQKIFRGSGLASWQSMQVWDGRLFRPLLQTSRDEIEVYCSAHHIPFRTDESNLEADYARNFLRTDWLPEMEQHFPGWRTNILRAADQSQIFDSALHYILADISDDKNRINRNQFLGLDSALQKAVLLYYTRHIDEAQKISRHALGELDKLHDLQTGKSIQLTESLELMRDRNHLKLVVNTGDPGTSVQINREKIEERSFSFNGLEFSCEPFTEPDFDTTLFLDMDVLAWPLRLRSWQKGDRFRPFGMEGHQTVAEHLTNRKISALHKQSALVLESFEETICAVIFPPIENRTPPGTIDEMARCGSSTRKSLTIKRIS